MYIAIYVRIYSRWGGLHINNKNNRRFNRSTHAHDYRRDGFNLLDLNRSIRLLNLSSLSILPRVFV